MRREEFYGKFLPLRDREILRILLVTQEVVENCYIAAAIRLISMNLVPCHFTLHA